MADILALLNLRARALPPMLANWLTVIVLVCFMVNFQGLVQGTAHAPLYLSHLRELRRLAVGYWLVGHVAAKLARRNLVQSRYGF